MSSTQEERLEAAHEMLVAKTEALATSEGWHEYLQFAARFHNYSLNNLLLILAQRPDATRIASYRKWQELGRQVNKGERSIGIFAPSTRKVKTEDKTTGEETERRIITGFRLVPVFDISQTSGDPLPEDPSRPVLLDGECPEGLDTALIKIANDHGYLLRFGPSERGENGYTSPKDKMIQLSYGLSDAQRAKTLIHEVAHMLLHCENEDLTADAILHRNVAEVEAESVAYLVALEHGLDAEAYTLPYISGWSDGKSEVVAATADRVLKTARAILAKTAPEPEEVTV